MVKFYGMLARPPSRTLRESCPSISTDHVPCPRSRKEFEVTDDASNPAMLNGRTSMKTLLAATAFAFSAAACTPANAADLSVALGADVTSMDPHFHNLTPNNNVAAHVFDALTTKSARGQLQPALAESWRAIDDTTWEFRLRKGVKFHDGSEFTAADVAFSLDRVPTVPNSPSPFTTYSKQITEKIIVDSHHTVEDRGALSPDAKRHGDHTHRLEPGCEARLPRTSTPGSDSGHRPLPLRALAKRRSHELARNDARIGARNRPGTGSRYASSPRPDCVASLLSAEFERSNVPTWICQK